MKELSFDFGRVLTAMATPFDDNLSIDYGQVKKLARHLVQSGSDGLVVAGTTGESPTLSKDEKIELFRVVVEEVGGEAFVIAGTGSNNTAADVELTQAAEKVGVDGVMLVGPYYNKPSQEGLYQHFKTIAQSTNLPVMLYNVPGRTAGNILPQTVIRLSEIDNIVAIKEASGILEQVAELRRNLPDAFAVYSGDDALTLPILSLGGKGVVSVASHIIGPQIQEMINAFNSGNVNVAAKIHGDLMPVFKVLFITSNPVPLKAALNMLGLQVGGPRLPLVEASQEEKDLIKKELTEAKLI